MEEGDKTTNNTNDKPKTPPSNQIRESEKSPSTPIFATRVIPPEVEKQKTNSLFILNIGVAQEKNLKSPKRDQISPLSSPKSSEKNIDTLGISKPNVSSKEKLSFKQKKLKFMSIPQKLDFESLAGYSMEDCKRLLLAPPQINKQIYQPAYMPSPKQIQKKEVSRKACSFSVLQAPDLYKEIIKVTRGDDVPDINTIKLQDEIKALEEINEIKKQRLAKLPSIDPEQIVNPPVAHIKKKVNKKNIRNTKFNKDDVKFIQKQLENYEEKKE